MQPPGVEALVYIALNMKASGTTLDRALQNVSFLPTAEVNKAGRVVQLNNLYEGEPGRFPVRLVRYTSPTGFVIAPSVLGLSGVVVYAEDRLDAAGQVTGAHRIGQRVADKDVSLAQEAEDIRHMYRQLDPGDIQEVALATPGVRAFVFPHRADVWGEEGHARTAVVRLDDLTLEFTWSTRGDEALAALDAAAFTQLLAGMQLAVRW